MTQQQQDTARLMAGFIILGLLIARCIPPAHPERPPPEPCTVDRALAPFPECRLECDL